MEENGKGGTHIIGAYIALALLLYSHLFFFVTTIFPSPLDSCHIPCCLPRANMRRNVFIPSRAKRSSQPFTWLLGDNIFLLNRLNKVYTTCHNCTEVCSISVLNTAVCN